MNTILKTLVLISFLILSACAGKTDAEKSIDQTNETLSKLETDIDAMGDNALAFSVNGGQPGRVSLAGGIVLSQTELDSRIHLESTTGRGKKGNHPKRDEKMISLKTQIATDISARVQARSVDSTYINLGCDESSLQTAGLKRLEPDFSFGVTFLNANKIFICGASTLKDSMVNLEASSITLRDVTFNREGLSANFLTLNTGELVLEGHNRISTHTTDGNFTAFAGPQLEISAAKISGQGDLEIKASGSNYSEK